MQTSTISQTPSQAAPAQTNLMTSMESPMVQPVQQQQQPQPALVAEPKPLPKEIESPTVSTSEPILDKGGNDIEQLESLNDDSVSQQQSSLPNEPKTYANLLKSGGGSISYSYAAMSSSSPSTYTSNQVKYIKNSKK